MCAANRRAAAAKKRRHDFSEGDELDELLDEEEWSGASYHRNASSLHGSTNTLAAAADPAPTQATLRNSSFNSRSTSGCGSRLAPLGDAGDDKWGSVIHALRQPSYQASCPLPSSLHIPTANDLTHAAPSPAGHSSPVMSPPYIPVDAVVTPNANIASWPSPPLSPTAAHMGAFPARKHQRQEECPGSHHTNKAPGMPQQQPGSTTGIFRPAMSSDSSCPPPTSVACMPTNPLPASLTPINSFNTWLMPNAPTHQHMPLAPPAWAVNNNGSTMMHPPHHQLYTFRSDESNQSSQMDSTRPHHAPTSSSPLNTDVQHRRSSCGQTPAPSTAPYQHTSPASAGPLALPTEITPTLSLVHSTLTGIIARVPSYLPDSTRVGSCTAPGLEWSFPLGQDAAGNVTTYRRLRIQVLTEDLPATATTTPGAAATTTPDATANPAAAAPHADQAGVTAATGGDSSALLHQAFASSDVAQAPFMAPTITIPAEDNFPAKDALPSKPANQQQEQEVTPRPQGCPIERAPSCDSSDCGMGLDMGLGLELPSLPGALSGCLLLSNSLIQRDMAEMGSNPSAW